MRIHNILLAATVFVFVGTILDWDLGFSQTPPATQPEVKPDVTPVAARKFDVTKNNSIDRPAEGFDFIVPMLSETNHTIKISVRLKAPNGLSFVPFSPNVYCDIALNPVEIMGIDQRLDGSELSISVILLKDNFGRQELRMEGNLAGKGTGSQPGVGVHWAAELDALDVHPQAADFAKGKEGRLIIAPQTTTTPATGTFHSTYQTTSSQVMITAGRKNSTGQAGWIFFRIIDPPNGAHYETAPQPNHDGENTTSRPATNGRYGYLSEYSADYPFSADLAMRVFDNQTDKRVIGVAVKSKVADNFEEARVVLNFTKRYSGDNYVVKAFPGTMPADNLTDACPKTTTMTAWYRAYIGTDEMSIEGAIVVGDSAFDPNGNPGQIAAGQGRQDIQVDKNADFKMGQLYEVWWPGQTPIPCGFIGKFVDPLTNRDVVSLFFPANDANNKPINYPLFIPKYAGIRAKNGAQYTLDPAERMALAFGAASTGPDTGAFVEFEWVGTKKEIGKCHVLYEDTTLLPADKKPPFDMKMDKYAKFWNQRPDGVIQLISGTRYMEGTGDDHWSGISIKDKFSYICTLKCNLEGLDRDETAVHEVGHQFVKKEGHVDVDQFAPAVNNPPGTQTHSCVMTYHEKAGDRFCVDHLIEMRDMIKWEIKP